MSVLSLVRANGMRFSEQMRPNITTSCDTSTHTPRQREKCCFESIIAHDKCAAVEVFGPNDWSSHPLLIRTHFSSAHTHTHTSQFKILFCQLFLNKRCGEHEFFRFSHKNRNSNFFRCTTCLGWSQTDRSKSCYYRVRLQRIALI